jgi:hypothetical protein
MTDRGTPRLALNTQHAQKNSDPQEAIKKNTQAMRYISPVIRYPKLGAL